MEIITKIEQLTRPHGAKSLQYMEQLLAEFGSPEHDLALIHIGGTNGKGSVAIMLANIFRAGGYKTATFTSPYLLSFHERIMIDLIPIPEADLERLAEGIFAAFPRLVAKGLRTPSFFEFIFLLALLYFREQAVDLAIIEVGIGGLLDNTNVIRPLASAVTSVACDHVALLGGSLATIWENKLGIMKAGVPFVIFDDPDYHELIVARAAASGARLRLLDKAAITDVKLSLSGTEFSYRAYRDLRLQLLGAHQAENAVLALELALAVADRFPVSAPAIFAGLARSTWRGRLEVVRSAPLILADGAHNIGAVERLVRFLAAEQLTGLTVIFACATNKDAGALLATLAKVAGKLIFTRYPSPRATDPSVYERLALPVPSVTLSFEEAVAYAKTAGEPVLVTGSLYLVGAFLAAFK